MSRSDQIPCLTVYQPWAHLIVYGAPNPNGRIYKNFENRSKPVPRTIEGRRVAIHAAMTSRKSDYEAAARILLDRLDCGRHPVLCPLGRILGIVTISTNPGVFGSPWRDASPHGWYLTNPERFPNPVPARGKQGIWYVDRGWLMSRAYGGERCIG